MAITVMAVIGLVVSVIAGWSQLTADSPAGQQQLGPPVVRVPEQRPEPEDEEAVGLPSDVGRSRAVPIQEDQQPYRPVRITVDTVGIDSAVRPVGVAADGQMELPPDPAVLGWYRFGPAPGAGTTEGSAVLAGHLDSRQYGLGPLVRLRYVDNGDLVEVTLSDGSTMTYRVQAVTRYDQQALPAELFARSGAPRLRIITCGGDYDVDAGGYQQNLVVTAVPT
jgi:hypothetical protein